MKKSIRLFLILGMALFITSCATKKDVPSDNGHGSAGDRNHSQTRPGGGTPVAANPAQSKPVDPKAPDAPPVTNSKPIVSETADPLPLVFLVALALAALSRDKIVGLMKKGGGIADYNQIKSEYNATWAQCRL